MGSNVISLEEAQSLDSNQHGNQSEGRSYHHIHSILDKDTPVRRGDDVNDYVND